VLALRQPCRTRRVAPVSARRVLRCSGGDRYGVNFQDHQGEDPHARPRTGVAGRPLRG
jgi:hypothetical protein